MNKKVKIAILAVLVLLVLGVLYKYSRKTENVNTSQGKIKVGFILPLTGDLSFYGELVQNSLMMSLDKNKIEYIAEDSGGDVKNAISIANKFIEVDKVDVLVSFLPPICEAVNPIAIKNHVLHFAFTQSPSIAQGNDYTLKHWAASEDEARVFLDYIKIKKPKKVAFLRHMYPDADLAFNTITKPELDKLGIEIIDMPFDLDIKDFRSLTLKLKSENPDIIVVQTLAFNYGNILTNLNNLGLLNKVVADLNYFNVKDLNEFSNPIYEGIPFVNMDLVTSDAYNNYLAKYKEDFKKESTVFGVFAYDLGLVLNNLNKNDLSKKSVISYYENNSVNGYGGRILYDNQGNLKIGYSLAQFKDGKIVDFNY